MVNSKVPIAVQISAFKKHKSDLFDGNRVKPSSAQVFKSLKKKLGMSVEAIRLSVVRNTNTILDINVPLDNGNTSMSPDTANQSIESQDEKANECDGSNVNESLNSAIANDSAGSGMQNENSVELDETVCDDDDVKNQGKLISFAVDVDRKDVFSTTVKKQGKKNRLKVNFGWGSKLRKIIWTKFKSQCSWSLKSADAKANGDISCNGHCTGCKAAISIRVVDECMNVEITNYDASINHPRKKSRLSVGERKYYAKQLQHSSAHLVVTNESNKVMKAGDPVPSFVPTENAARIIKYESGIMSTSTTTTSNNSRYWKNALWSLVELKYVFKPDVMGDLYISPFFVQYALPMQKEFYKLAVKRKRKILSIDATGLNIRTSSFLPKVPKERKMPVFLYTIACHSSGKTMPIYQVLSDRHTLSFHCNWLNEWIKNNKNVDEIILDDSAALVGACVKTFAQCKNTNEYISKCMDSLLSGTPPPKAQIRLDRSHFVKSLHRMSQLNKEDIRKKALFTRVFGFLILCESLDVVECTIQDLFIVIRSEYATQSCVRSLENLKNICLMDDPNAAQIENDESYVKIRSTIESSEEDNTYKNTTSYR